VLGNVGFVCTGCESCRGCVKRQASDAINPDTTSLVGPVARTRAWFHLCCGPGLRVTLWRDRKTWPPASLYFLVLRSRLGQGKQEEARERENLQDAAHTTHMRRREREKTCRTARILPETAMIWAAFPSLKRRDGDDDVLYLRLGTGLRLAMDGAVGWR